MDGRTYIDGVDLYTRYGLYVPANGYNGLVEWPSLKAIDINDWHEEDGVEPDLSAPVLDSRTFGLHLAGRPTMAQISALFAHLKREPYHEIDAAEIGRRTFVRLVGNPRLDYYGDLLFVELTLADDYPLNGYSYLSPSSTIEEAEGAAIDGNNFSDYGVRLLEGTKSSFENRGEVKQNLMRNIASEPGVEYDNSSVRFKAYDATLGCLLRAETQTELWRNYDALLYDLVRPGKRIINIPGSSKYYDCYYLSSNVRRFFGSGKLWLEFDINVNVFNLPY